MNVRIIDPRRPAAGRPRAWGREAIAEDFGDLDEDGPAGGSPESDASSDDRFDLLFDLRHRLSDLLSACLEEQRACLLSGGARACFAGRQEELGASLRVLRQVAEELGLEIPAAPPESATRARLREADGSSASGPAMLAEALFLNSLGTTMLAAMLCEADAPAWRGSLLPVLQDDCRFEGRLKGYLEEAGERAEALGRERIALAQGVKPAASQRLWSFDLLRMSIRRLLGEGPASVAGGAFPAPGAGPPAGGSW